MSDAATAIPARGFAPVRPGAGWPHSRVALVIAWVLLAGFAVGTGQRVSSLDRLRSDVADGQVPSISVRGGLARDSPGGTGAPDGDSGYAVLAVVWSDGLLTRRTEVMEVSRDATAPDQSLPVVHEDLVQQLTATRPGLRVLHGADPGSSSTLFGFRTPFPLGIAWFLLEIAQLSLLMGGPEPLRATRWAWLWIWLSPLPAVLFPLLSGRLAGLPPPRGGRRRLTGGSALLLAALLLAAVHSV